jgi:AraC-like DNA-binding protein
MLSVFDHRKKVISTIQYVYSVIFILQFIHLGYFLFKNLKLVNSYSKELVSEYSMINSKIKWLKYFNITLLFILIFSAIFLYILLVTDIYRRHFDYIYVLPIGFLFYLITFYFIRTEWEPTDKNIIKYVSSSLNSNLVPEYITKLNQLMDTEKMYLNQNLRLNDLAEKMTLSKHHLSQIINQHFKVSFFDFINQYRTNEAKKTIKNNPEQPLIQVAFDAGFNNKTSFVNSFKKFEKTTPSKFRETVLNS